MKIEIKNVSFNERMSEETNAFVADVYVNGKKCGYAKNDGRGGSTFVNPYGGKYRDLFVEGERYCESLPDVVYNPEGMKPFSVKSNMENVVDELFEQWLKNRDQKKLEKKMENHIMWGVPNGHSYMLVKFLKPLNQIDKKIIQSYLDKYKTEFKEGEKFLNTNLDGFNL